MNRIKNILALTDLSEFSRDGVRYALNLARTLGSEVTVYHVVHCGEFAQSCCENGENVRIDVASPKYERLKRRYQLDLARFLNQHFSDLIPWVKIREKIEIGVPEKNIVEWAKRESADLVVISTHATSDLAEGFSGSLAAKIVVSVSCPVLCLHVEAEEKALRPVTQAC
jgi:nucleotide-binding universal stress UspA family protein